MFYNIFTYVHIYTYICTIIIDFKWSGIEKKNIVLLSFLENKQKQYFH